MDVVTWPTEKVLQGITKRVKYPINNFDYVTSPEFIRHSVSLSAFGGIVSLFTASLTLHRIISSEQTLGEFLFRGAVVALGISIGFAQLDAAYKLMNNVSK